MADIFKQKRRTGLFGAPVSYPPTTPPIAPQQAPQTAMGAPGQGFAPQQPQKPGFFGQGGAGRAIAGSIGDALLQYSGMAPIYAPQMQQQQAIAAQQAAAQRKRSMDLADWRMKQDYQTANRAPTSLQQNYEWLKRTDPAAADAYLERMTNNYEYRQGADGRFYRIDIADQQPQVLGTELPAGWTVQGGGQAMSSAQGGQVLQGAAQTNTISQADAARIRQSLGPNGQAAFQNWMRENNIVIGAR